MGTRTKRNRVALVAAIVVIAAGSASASGSPQVEFPSLLIDTEWLEANLDTEGLVIIDTGRGAEDFSAGHIPGAVELDRSIYYGEVDGVPGMFTGVETVEAALREIGVNNDSGIVVYDSGNGLWATRLFWTLELLGHDNVVVLDGGSAKWLAEDRAIATGAVDPEPGEFTADYQPQLVVSGNQIKESIDEYVVIDARSVGEYEGEDVRAARGGHIPGAINVDWVLNNTGGEVSTFLPKDELAEFYDVKLDGADGKVVTHCQTGVRGAHTYFALRLLGYEDVALYDASWVEWGNDEAFPVEAN